MKGTMIDLYCERTAIGFWNEPFNALTNLAFLVAAFFLMDQARQHHRLHPSVVLLAILCAAIGVGSFLFHTFASPWSLNADVWPILLFQIAFLFLYCRRIVNTGLGRSLLIVLSFLLVNVLTGQIPERLNGSIVYLPSLLFLGALSIYHFRNRCADRCLLLKATVLFLVSLFFRTLDLALCGLWPVGTHFLWHLLNGLVLYLVGRAYMLNLPRTT